MSSTRSAGALLRLNPTRPPLREWLWLVMYASPAGQLWAFIQIIVSFLGSVWLIIQNYLPITQTSVDIVGIILMVLIFLDLGLRNYAENPRRRRESLVSLATAVDLCCILPQILELTSVHGSSSIQFLKSLRIFRTLRIFDYFRNLSTSSRVKRIDSIPVPSLLVIVLEFAFQVAGILFVGAYAFQAFQQIGAGDTNSEKTSTVDFHTALYWAVVTGATVGYGDVVPTTLVSRWFTMLYIMTTVVVVPLQASKVVEALTSRRKNPRQREHLLNENIVLAKSAPAWITAAAAAAVEKDVAYHIILAGEIEPVRFAAVARLLLHAFQTAGKVISIALLIKPPVDKSLRYFLQSPAIGGKIWIVIGDALNQQDLLAAGLAYASTVILLEDVAKVNGDALSHWMLECSSVKNDLVLCNNEACSISLQVHSRIGMLPADRDLFALAMRRFGGNVFIIEEEVLANVVGASIACHGFSTFIENLLLGSLWQLDLGIAESAGSSAIPSAAAFDSVFASSTGIGWLDAYICGLKNGVRMTPVNCPFASDVSAQTRVTVAAAARTAWRRGVIVIGLFHKGVFSPFGRSWWLQLQDQDVLVSISRSPALVDPVASDIAELLVMESVRCAEDGTVAKDGRFQQQQQQQQRQQPSICERSASVASGASMELMNDVSSQSPLAPSSSTPEPSHLHGHRGFFHSPVLTVAVSAAGSEGQFDRSALCNAMFSPVGCGDNGDALPFIAILSPLSPMLLKLLLDYHGRRGIGFRDVSTVVLYWMQADGHGAFGTDGSGGGGSNDPALAAEKNFLQNLPAGCRVSLKRISPLHFLHVESVLLTTNATRARSIFILDDSKSQAEMLVLYNCARQVLRDQGSSAQLFVDVPGLSDQWSVLHPSLTSCLDDPGVLDAFRPIWRRIQSECQGLMFHTLQPAFFSGSVFCAKTLMDGLLALTSINGLYVEVAVKLCFSFSSFALSTKGFPGSRTWQALGEAMLSNMPSSSDAVATAVGSMEGSKDTCEADPVPSRGLFGIPVAVIRSTFKGERIVITNPPGDFELVEGDHLLAMVA